MQDGNKAVWRWILDEASSYRNQWRDHWRMREPNGLTAPSGEEEKGDFFGRADAAEFKKTIGANIRQKRKAHKLTQQDLENRMKMRRARIGNIENGKTDFTVEELFQFSRVLECRVVDLLPQEPSVGEHPKYPPEILEAMMNLQKWLNQEMRIDEGS